MEAMCCKKFYLRIFLLYTYFMEKFNLQIQTSFKKCDFVVKLPKRKCDFVILLGDCSDMED